MTDELQYRMGTTITEHLLQCEEECPTATGQFTQLLSELTTGAKLIAREINNQEPEALVTAGGEQLEQFRQAGVVLGIRRMS